MRTCLLTTGAPVSGSLRPPGDKSISHRAVLFATLARGRSRIVGLSEGDDVQRTLAAVAALGASVHHPAPGLVEIEGCGGQGWRAPAAALDLGNAGTALRLLLGAVCGQPGLELCLTGDDSLCARPNDELVGHLRRMGAEIQGSGPREQAPLFVRGRALTGARHELRTASAQISTALLIAGRDARGRTEVHLPGPCRDHGPRALRHFGWPVTGAGARWTLRGGPAPSAPPEPFRVPGDLSAAAFYLAAAAPVPGASLRVTEVGLNPGRLGFLERLRRMGAAITVHESGDWSGEPTGEIRVEGGPLVALEDEGEALGEFVDEVPILAALATRATGRTRLAGLAPLRGKESDRVRTTAALLQAVGATVEERGDSLVIVGSGPLRPARVDSHGDHRIAMTAAILALWGARPLKIDGAETVETSYPGFFDDLARLGGASVEWSEEESP